jgi:hypothetical protein
MSTLAMTMERAVFADGSAKTNASRWGFKIYPQRLHHRPEIHKNSQRGTPVVLGVASKGLCRTRGQ